MSGRSSAAGSESDVDQEGPVVRATRRVLTVVEDVVYLVIAALLVAGAVAVLVAAGATFRDLGSTSTSTFALALLDSLLLVFIFVELLAAVKLTLKRREIIAEPFLLVGIVASIKEIVVLSVEAADVMSGTKDAASSASVYALQIGVLGAVALALAVSAWLLRLKEREPEESQ